MKEAIGGIPIIQIVIIFIIIFAGIMGLTINHSKAFAVRDEIITIIESEDPKAVSNKLSDKTIEKIKNHLKEIGYRTTKKCPDASWDGYDRDGNAVGDGAVASFCIRAVDVAQNYINDVKEKCKDGNCVVVDYKFPSMYYYDVILFYELNIPMINQLMKFDLQGSTRIIFGEVGK
jgi:hypothetical protein